MIYAAFRAWKTLRRYFISLPSKTAFYCVTKSREPTTNESDVFSALACTLFVSVDDKLVSILPYHRKAKDKLILIIKYFLLFQFLIISLLLIGIVTMIFVFHGLGNDLDISYIDIIIKFVSVYITSVVAELIAMLHYIVSKVFDTSITGLVEIYKDATNTKNDRLKEQEN